MLRDFGAGMSGSGIQAHERVWCVVAFGYLHHLETNVSATELLSQ
jgi:hypothetical protein